jgi:hypothetical protein
VSIRRLRAADLRCDIGSAVRLARIPDRFVPPLRA